MIALLRSLLVPCCRISVPLSILGRKCLGNSLRNRGNAFAKDVSLISVIFTESFSQQPSTAEKSSFAKSFSLRYRIHPLAVPTLIGSANSEQKGLEETDNDVMNLRCCGPRGSLSPIWCCLQRNRFLCGRFHLRSKHSGCSCLREERSDHRHRKILPPCIASTPCRAYMRSIAVERRALLSTTHMSQSSILKRSVLRIDGLISHACLMFH